MVLNFYRRAGSRFWYVQFTDPTERDPKKARRNVSTKIESVRKVGDLPTREEGRALKDYEAKLRGRLFAADPESVSEPEHFDAWVGAWIRQRWGRGESALTGRRYLIRWKYLAAFLHEKGIQAPCHLVREHCFAYVDWRCGQIKPKSGKAISVNTARSELRFLGQVLKEAVHRRYVDKNVARELNIAPVDPAIKPEHSDEQIMKIQEALELEPEWMRISWNIALLTGCRSGETRIKRTDFCSAEHMVHFPKPKGGKKKAYTITLLPAAEAYLAHVFADGRCETFTVDAKTWEFRGLAWRKFFNKVDLPSPYSFHSTRVTFVSRCLRGGIPPKAIKEMVNHANDIINELYQRIRVADVRAYAAQLAFPDPLKKGYCAGVPPQEEGQTSSAATP